MVSFSTTGLLLHVALFPPGTTYDCAIGQAGPSIWSRLPPAILHEVSMRRIGLAVVLTLSLIAAPRAPEAQQAVPPRRIAVVIGRSPLDTIVGAQPSNPNMRAFLDGLRDLGYVEGRNIVIERRALEGHMEQVPTVIQDLLRLKVEVILAAALDVAVATQRITATVPIGVVDATYE